MSCVVRLTKKIFYLILKETDDYRYFDPKMLRGSERYENKISSVAWQNSVGKIHSKMSHHPFLLFQLHPQEQEPVSGGEFVYLDQSLTDEIQFRLFPG